MKNTVSKIISLAYKVNLKAAQLDQVPPVSANMGSLTFAVHVAKVRNWDKTSFYFDLDGLEFSENPNQEIKVIQCLNRLADLLQTLEAEEKLKETEE